MENLIQNRAPMKTAQFEGEMGRMIQESTLKRALKTLHPGFHFDVGGNLDMDHPYIGQRQGVYFNGRHICSMDRGSIPEAKVWMCFPGLVDIEWGDIDDYDDAQIIYVEIQRSDPEFEDAWRMFESKKDGYHVDLNGKLFHYRACRMGHAPNYVEYVGWSHTLYRILNHNIPGVTKRALCQLLGLNAETIRFNEKVAFMVGEQS